MNKTITKQAKTTNTTKSNTTKRTVLIGYVNGFQYTEIRR